MGTKSLNLLKEEKTQQLTCSTKSEEFTRQGNALVSVTKKEINVLVFHEKGTWSGKQAMNFSNIFRWTLDLNAN